MTDRRGINSLFWLDETDPQAPFPPVELALRDPDGLLAFGGDLSNSRILRAYRAGIFPWYSEGQPIMWWSPDPRSVLFPEELKISRSLRKTMKKQPFELSINRAFIDVIAACAKPRADDEGTWITRAMRAAYTRLHRDGHAISVEAWHQGELVGGLYGIAMGRVFFGESMFARMTDASKVAFAGFVQQLQHWGYRLIDCQVESAHLNSLGARQIPRSQFIDYLDQWCDTEPARHAWRFENGIGD